MSSPSAPADPHTAGALSGLKVLDTATLYAAPFISTLLADHGADVVKVEPPGGDPYRRHPANMWPLLARGKRSVELDLRSEEGCEALRRLTRGADVVVANMPPATLAKRGLDYETLSRDNPGLIMAVVSGFGLDGPYSGRPGNGTLGEAYSGLTHMTGPPDGSPVLASVPLGDAVTGMVGALGVLAACYHRLAHGGPGQLIDVNPIDALLHVAAPAHSEYRGSGEPAGRLANRLTGSIVRNVFPTADGLWVSISASTERHVEDLAQLSGHRERDPAGAPSGDLEGSVRAWTSARARTEVVDELVARRLPVGPVYDARDCREDPHLVARGAIRTIETSESGPIAIPAAAPRLTGTPGRLHVRTHDVDEDRAAVLGPGGWDA